MDALAAHTTMSKQALDSDRVRSGLKDIRLGPAQLYAALRATLPGACQNTSMQPLHTVGSRPGAIPSNRGQTCGQAR
jgi:hypothetical protein